MLERLHHASEILGIERSGEPRRVDELAEHDGDLAALGLSSLDRSALRPLVASRLRARSGPGASSEMAASNLTRGTDR